MYLLSAEENLQWAEMGKKVKLMVSPMNPSSHIQSTPYYLHYLNPLCISCFQLAELSLSSCTKGFNYIYEIMRRCVQCKLDVLFGSAADRGLYPKNGHRDR